MLVLVSVFLVQGVLAACDSFEPLGACPETDLALRDSVTYTNTVREDSSYYYFDYNGTDMDITYRFTKAGNNSCWSPYYVSCMDVYANDGSMKTITHPAKGDPKFEFLNGTTYKQYYTYETLVLSNISKHYLGADDTVLFSYRYQLRDDTDSYSDIVDYEDVDFNISIKGKSLFITQVGSRGKWVSTTMDSVESATYNLTLFDFDTYSSEVRNAHEIIMIDNSLFYNIDFVFDKSKYTTDGNTDSTYASSTKINYRKGAEYLNLSNGVRPNLNDTIFFVISDNVQDVLLNNPNERSSYYNTIKGNSWYRAASTCGYNTCINTHTGRYYNYGLPVDTFEALWGSVGSQAPWPYNFSFGNTQSTLDNTHAYLSPLNVGLSSYLVFQDIDQDSPIYNTTTYEGIFINGTNRSYVMKDSEGEPFYGWLTDYVVKYERRSDIYNLNKQNISDWHNTFLNLDTEGANTLAYTDREADSGQNGSLSNQIPYRKQYLEEIQNDYYIFTENYEPLWTAGLIDAGDGSQGCCTDLGNDGVIPDHGLTQINTKMVVSQPYIQYYMVGWDNNDTKDWGDTPTDEFYHDRYIVESNVRGQRPLLDGHMAELHGIPENRTILQFYATDYITQLMYSSSINSIEYSDGVGGWNTLSESLAQNYDFNNSIIKEVWNNGLTIIANLNRTGWYNSTINNKVRNMPPNSIYAYGAGIELFYNDNNQSHWISTPTYAYLYPKNDQTITFVIPEKNYEVFEYYDGERISQYTTTSQINSHQTSEVRYLRATTLSNVAQRAEKSYDDLCTQGLSAFGLVSVALIALVGVAIIMMMMGRTVDLPTMIIVMIVASIFMMIGIKIINALTGGC